MEKTVMIEMMKKQHDNLQEDLLVVQKEINLTDFNIKIAESLAKFKSDLLGHLAIEDNQFYPSYLERLKKQGEDTSKTELFISEMNHIKDAVTAFLAKYETSDNVRTNISQFPLELEQIIRTLNLRIESEEEGVYEMFLLV